MLRTANRRGGGGQHKIGLSSEYQEVPDPPGIFDRDGMRAYFLPSPMPFGKKNRIRASFKKTLPNYISVKSFINVVFDKNIPVTLKRRLCRLQTADREGGRGSLVLVIDISRGC